MIWNIEDCKEHAGPIQATQDVVSDAISPDNAPRDWKMTTSWESTIHDLTWTFDDGQPRFRHEKWRKCFDDQLASSPLSLTSTDPLFSLPLGESSVKFETWLSKDDISKRYGTQSQIAVLEGEKLEVSGDSAAAHHVAEIITGGEEQVL